MGASWLALLGAFVGTIVGLFFSIPGLIFGPFLGAVAGEWIAVRNLRQAGKVGVGTWLGMILGIGAKLALVFVMVGISRCRTPSQGTSDADSMIIGAHAVRRVVGRAVDVAADGEGFKAVHGVRDEKGLKPCRILGLRVQPQIEVLGIDDHRHPIVERPHQGRWGTW